MTEKEKKLKEIVDLQGIVIKKLLDSLDKVIDCKNLPCNNLIEQIEKLKKEYSKK